MNKLNYFLICLIIWLTGLFPNYAQIQVELPETYELSNIVLALTDYGKSDQWEVQKQSTYYKEVLSYFDSVKNHPLLKAVNYSRDKWEDYLSFRTDAISFNWNAEGKLTRTKSFYTNEGHRPFDDQLALVEDFVTQSKFRIFYKNHKAFYDSLVTNYSSYYMLTEIKRFLDLETGYKLNQANASVYKIILSPLVGRMNCHRTIDSLTQADFPSLSADLIQNFSKSLSDTVTRITELHTLFTEMDHAYINPLSEKFKTNIKLGFNTNYWDRKSGYTGVDVFNEYMTWAVYDLFVHDYFLRYADSLSLQWHYQNASRGFYASHFFAQKLKSLYKKRLTAQTLKDLYLPLLKWTASVQALNKPVKLILKQDSVYTLNAAHQILLNFSTPMQTTDSLIGVQVMKIENGKGTNTKQWLKLTAKQWQWLNPKQALVTITSSYPQFALVFNWWGINYPLKAKTGILLSPSEYILIKQNY